MRNYTNGYWGIGFLWTLRASPFPRAFVLALPNAVITYFLADIFQPNHEPEQEKLAFSLWAGFTSVLGFLLFFRSNTAYSRWWEGGTLLQQVRGEWFNAYSSLIAFCTPDTAKQDAVEEFQHMLGRLMSLLFCSALQQVTPNTRGRSFEIIEVRGIDRQSLNFLSSSGDAVEVIIQWIQRSTVLGMGSGVLHVPPPVLSRVFQELSRGIVNLQNARKIAEFPFPFPLAQTSVVLLLIHWCVTPIITGLMLEKYIAAATSFVLVFFFWCVNFIALSLEMPYGEQENDLPLDQMQSDWNKSLKTLLTKTAQCPPQFQFDREIHSQLKSTSSSQLQQDLQAWLASKCESESDAGYDCTDVQLEDPLEETPKSPEEQPVQEAPAVESHSHTSAANGCSDGQSAVDKSRQCPQLGVKAKDLLLFDPPERDPAASHEGAPPSGPHEVGAMVIGACGGTITVNGLAERDRESSQSSSARPSMLEAKQSRPPRTSGRAQSAGPHRSMDGRPPPWNWEMGSSKRGGRGPSMECSAGCLQALVRLRPTAVGASVTFGS